MASKRLGSWGRVVVALIALTGVAFAGVRLAQHGNGYTATPQGGSGQQFDVKSMGGTLENWIDGKEYVWKDTPGGGGYYQHTTGGVEDGSVNFTSGGTYTTTGPSGNGSYAANP